VRDEKIIESNKWKCGRNVGHLCRYKILELLAVDTADTGDVVKNLEFE